MDAHVAFVLAAINVVFTESGKMFNPMILMIRFANSVFICKQTAPRERVLFITLFMFALQ